MNKLFWLDFLEAQDVLDNINEILEHKVNDFLFKYFIIAYSRPFSRNKDEEGKKGIFLSEKHIDKHLKSLHCYIIRLRNELIAHSDYLKKFKQELPPNNDNELFSYEVNSIDYTVFVNEYGKDLRDLLKCNIVHTFSMNQKCIRGSSSQLPIVRGQGTENGFR